MNYNLKIACPLIGLLFVFGTSPAGADALKTATLKLCEKLKHCVAVEFEKTQPLSEEMRTVLNDTMKEACDRIHGDYSIAYQQESLLAPAVACVESMAKLECGDLKGRDKPKTEECIAFESDYNSLN